MNVWIYATLAFVLVGVVGLGVYFLANQLKQNDSNKSEMVQSTETQISNNLTNFENVNVMTNSNRTVNITPIPSSNPTVIPKQTVVKLRLEPEWINGRGDGLFTPSMTAILSTSEGKFTGRVNNRGVITFDNIPCNEQITIALPPEQGLSTDTVYYKRFIKCDKPTVNLGKLKIGGYE